MKKYLILIIGFIIMGCTGCVTSQYELTEQENDIIAEYIAGTLLQHDIGYTKKLLFETEEVIVPEDNLSENVIPEENPTEIQNNKPAETQAEPKYHTLEDIYSNYSIQVTYKNFKSYSHYPEENDSFNLEAGTGNELLVLFFQVKGSTAKQTKLNLMGSGVQYDLKINNGASKKPLLTALTNDLQYLDIETEANKSEEAVIVFQVPKGTKPEQCSMYVGDGTKTAQVKIK